MQVSEQTLKDLEFQEILEQIAQFAFAEQTILHLMQLRPIDNFDILKQELSYTNEYLSGIQRGESVPFSEFFDLDVELERLEIENYYLPAESFFKIKSNALQIKEILKYLEKFKVEFPFLFLLFEEVIYEKEIVKNIDNVFNKFGDIKDEASSELKSIRDNIRRINARITELFNKSLVHHASVLDDIRESVVDSKRVLAVKSALRKRVKGQFLGTSKTGSISFIEPESTLNLRREWEEYKAEEKKEIVRILTQLTHQISLFKPILIQYQEKLEHLDLTQAKAKYADSIQGILPQIVNEPYLELKSAFHPILLANNQRRGDKTIPQDLGLNKEQRIIIISGPNAGGKSITLKTVGLLQLMVQSGILIPVHENSIVGIFEKLFTDIGDNQSIENHLSTYSYRLKQMAIFLKKSDEKTLLLVDEFGTGSDPELGGALAEVFFEEFYEKKSFGIFTTHYTNIKLSAEKLPQAINASMLFDKHSLDPLYKLEIGQAGSSFTFEVAEKNKIPYRLINRAKKKVENDKIRLDKTILKLQQEKFEIQKTRNEVEEIKEVSSEQAKEVLQTQEKISQKLFDFQQLYDKELKALQTGKKINELSDQYLKSKNKKQLIAQFLKLVEMENAKKSPQNNDEIKINRLIEKEVKKELKENKAEIAQQKEVIHEQKKVEKAQKIAALKVGDRVKIKDSNSVGTIDKIKNEMVFINYGLFITKISIFEVVKI